ncbi:MAG: hypothetical protein RLZZ591_1562 [Pseudomonadota bacterium]
MLRALSLTTRLTLFFTLVAAGVVLGLGALFVVASEEHFLELDRMALQDKQHVITDILSSAYPVEDTQSRLREALNHHHGLFVLVVDAQGHTLFQTDGFQPPPALMGPAGASSEPSFLQWADPQRAFHGLRFQSGAGDDAATRLRILVAIDTAHHTLFMRELRQTLAWYALAAIVVSGLLGWLAAHRGLTPLRAMKNRAAAVSGQQLGQRMPVEAVPIEMADLAHALNQMLARLQDDFRRLSEFSSDLAHELRTPISNVLTQTQVALSTPRDAEAYRDILASNAEEFQRLGRMVSDMLFLAKTERGMALPRLEPFEAAEEVHALLEFYEAVAADQQITLRQQGQGTIVGDRLMFRRAVSNLLSNALRYTPPNGEVNIDIEHTPGETRVSVTNTGPDIDPMLLPRLFDRFYRADASRAHPESEGAGLGLSITRAIVQAHGGSVQASSSGGKTCFVLVFPQDELGH